MEFDEQTWARIDSEGHNVLRRGAWYRVSEEDDDSDTLSLEVRDMYVPVDRKSVTVRTDRPSFWSVVDRSEEDLEEEFPEGFDFPPVYAVCPTCQARQEFTDPSGTPPPEAMLCQVCGKRSDVDWEETC